MPWVAKRAVHVGGVGACAAGAVLADGEPLVAARPSMFVEVVSEVADPVPADADPGDPGDVVPKKPRRRGGEA